MTESMPLSVEQARDAALLLSEALDQLDAAPTTRAYVEGAIYVMRDASAIPCARAGRGDNAS